MIPIAQAATLAAREVRHGASALRLLALCVFLGVLAMAAVGAVSAAIEGGIALHARAILGGDIEATFTSRPPTVAEMKALDRLGGRTTRSIRLQGMAQAGSAQANGAGPVLVTIRAVDRNWPLYGTAHLAGGGANRAVQSALQEGAVVSRQLAARLPPGTRAITLGDATLPVAGILLDAPDAASAGFALAPTVLLSPAALAQTGLIRTGSLYHERVRVALPDGVPVATARRSLDQALPAAGWRLRDTRDGIGGMTRYIDNLEQFLTLAALVTLVTAGAGAAYGVRAFLDRRRSTIATLRMLGAPTRLIATTYLLLVLGVAFLAALAGAFLGALLPLMAGRLAGPFLPFALDLRIHVQPIASSILCGLLAATAAALVPVFRASRLSAARVLRLGATRPPWPGAWAILLSLTAILLIVALTAAGAHKPLLLLAFFGAVLVLAAILYLVGMGLALLARHTGGGGGFVWRQALRNLSRPAGSTPALVALLGVGLALVAALMMAGSSLRHTLRQALPGKAPDLVVLDIPKAEKDAFVALLGGQARAELVPAIRGPITRVNGMPVSRIGKIPDDLWVLRGDRSVTFSARPPANNRITAGAWWPPDYAGPPLVSMDAEQARLLGLGVGDSLTVSILGVDVTARIASLREIDWESLGFNFVLIYNPTALEAAPYAWMAAIHGAGGDKAALVRKIAAVCPSASVLDISDVATEIDRIAGQIFAALRVATGMTLVAAIAALGSALSAETGRRRREAVLLRMLGATRRQITGATAIEFGLLGGATAILAVVLGGAVAYLGIQPFFAIGWHVEWGRVALLVAGATGAILLAGIVHGRRILGVPANEALRRASR